MSGREKEQAVSAGYTIPGKRLFGSEHEKTRAAMREAGCTWDGKRCLWICPDRMIWERFRGAAGLSEDDAPRRALKPVRLPPPPAEGPPPLEQLELKATVVKPAPAPAAEPVKASSGLAPVTQIRSGKKLLALPPSFIVTQEVGLRAAISYETLDIEATERERADETKEHETVRTVRKIVVNPEEYAAAQYLASQIRQRVRLLGRVLQVSPPSRELAQNTSHCTPPTFLSS